MTTLMLSNNLAKASNRLDGYEPDPVLLSLFSNRFMTIAEVCGETLRRCAVSENIRSRLDFSLGIFGPDGGLVANAPHLPVHLGSMSYAVKYIISQHGHEIYPGDVIMSNHPLAGGTHLPDITVITPVFKNPNGSKNKKENPVIFWVAARGHHADIGGILPGSMPPTSKTLSEEGAATKFFKLVSDGNFDTEGVTRILLHEPAQTPGCNGTRCLSDNISDLKAQIAANQKGINLLGDLVNEYGLEVVQAYMIHIRNNAEQAVRNLLRNFSKRFEGKDLWAKDYLDDGSPIELRVKIDPNEGSAVFDFEGTGPEMYGNLNAPTSITYSAIIYCLRCLVNQDIPLNQGCLAPITVKIPDNCFLKPSATAAVVGGNVLTSQRLTDVILKAFEACSASQGDCNNLTFGKGGAIKDDKQEAGFGYYETIAGGSGAGPGWDGTSGVHTHMTNTRIGDVEVMERRYPVLVREFSIRQGSGGDGQYRGGDGVTRDIEFLEPVQVSILSERRVHHPYGLNGGEAAQCGLNLWIRKGNKPGEPDRVLNLGGKNTAPFEKGDRIIINTPGGGGWGLASSKHVDGRKKVEGIVQDRTRGSVADRRALQYGV